MSNLKYINHRLKFKVKDKVKVKVKVKVRDKDKDKVKLKRKLRLHQIKYPPKISKSNKLHKKRVREAGAAQ